MPLPPKAMLIKDYAGLHLAKGGKVKKPVSQQSGLELAQGGDDTLAAVQHPDGSSTPAALKQGEIVFSVEAVIGAGNGDYHKGAQFLLALHEKLQEKGEKLLKKQ